MPFPSLEVVGNSAFFGGGAFFAPTSFSATITHFSLAGHLMTQRQKMSSSDQTSQAATGLFWIFNEKKVEKGKEESKQAIKQHQNLGRNCRMNNLRKQIGASRPGSYFL